MDSRDYDAISIELIHPNQSKEHIFISKLPIHAAFGKLQDKYWDNLEQQETLTWQPGNNVGLFPELNDLCVGGCVAIYVNEQVVGLIAAAYQNPEKSVRTTNAFWALFYLLQKQKYSTLRYIKYRIYYKLFE